MRHYVTRTKDWMWCNVARGLGLVQAAGVMVTLRRLGDKAAALIAAGCRVPAMTMCVILLLVLWSV